MGLKELIRILACAVCQGMGKPKPEIELLSMPSLFVADEVVAEKLKLLYPVLLDSGQDYYYTKAAGWAEVFDYIYFKFPMPKYIVGRMDCEDFAMMVKGLVSALFGLNYFGVVFGNTPFGYHGWNILRSDGELWQFEPQTGECFPLGEEGYKPEYVLL